LNTVRVVQRLLYAHAAAEDARTAAAGAASAATTDSSSNGGGSAQQRQQQHKPEQTAQAEHLGGEGEDAERHGGGTAVSERARVAREYARWNAALCAAATAHLARDPAAIDRHCGSGLLTPDERAWLRASPNAASDVLGVLAELLELSGLPPIERLQALQELTAFDIALGACERIRGQALPLAYTRHTSRCIMSYLTFLPFALFAYLGWATPFVNAALAFLLCGECWVGFGAGGGRLKMRAGTPQKNAFTAWPTA
jgi:hypothetical protein